MGSDKGDENENNESLADSRGGGKTVLNRRSYMKMAGAALTGAGLAASDLTGRVAAARTASDFQFDTVLNAVDDLGADPNGNEDVVPIIENNYASNTKIEFPPGEYKLGSTWVDTGSSVSNFGLVGTGSSPRDVQFVVPDGRFNDTKAVALMGPKSAHLFKNWSIQLTTNGDRAFPMRIDTEDASLFEDLEWLGSVADQNTSDQGQVLAVATTTQSGVNTARRLVIGKDAAAQRPGYPDGRAGIRVDGAHSGEMILEDLHVERQGSSAFRLAAAPGVLTVLGGVFKNNDNTNIRFSGGDHPSKHSVIDGAEVVIDDVDHSSQAIHVDNSNNYHSGAVVKNVDVKVTDSTAGQPAIASPSWADHGSISFYNCCVQNDVGVYTVDIDDVSMSDDDIVIDGCHFTGSGKGIDVSGRDGSVMKNSCFDMSDGSISGLSTENVSNQGCDSPSFGDDTDGGSGDDGSLAVSTGNATDLTQSSATLTGDLTGLGGADSAVVGFEYRETGASSWTATASQTLSSTGSFSETVTDLSTGIEYEFRAVAAASNGDTDAGSAVTFDTSLPNDLTIDGSNISSQIDYEITVSEEIQKGDRANDNDTIEGTTAVGQVNGGIDTYDFAGEVTDVRTSDDVPVYVNGEQIDTSSSDYPNSLKVDGSNISSQIEYEITVSDGIVKGDRANDNDTVEGTTAVGQVNGGIDTYDFAGEVTDVRTSDDVPIYVNGEKLDQSQSDYPNSLKVDGSNISSQIEYEVTVSDGIVKGEYANDNDTVEGSTAVGQVWGGYDTYDFAGEVTDVRTSDDVPIYVNGEEIDQSQFGDSGPSVDRFKVTEANSPNPHANITAEWNASDDDGNLSGAIVRVRDSSGELLRTSATQISGDVHYGVDYFEVKHVRDQTLTVTVTVYDDTGNEASASSDVTE